MKLSDDFTESLASLVGVHKEPITSPDAALIELRKKYLMRAKAHVKEYDDPDVAQMIILVSSTCGIMSVPFSPAQLYFMPASAFLLLGAGGVAALFTRRRRINKKVVEYADRISVADKSELDELISEGRYSLPRFTEEHGRCDLIPLYRSEIQEYLRAENKKIGNMLRDPFFMAGCGVGVAAMICADKAGMQDYNLLAALPFVAYLSIIKVYAPVKKAKQIENKMRQETERFTLEFLLQNSDRSSQMLYNLCK